MNPRIFFFGVGAIGASVGAWVGEKYDNLVFYDRPEITKAIREKGLTAYLQGDKAQLAGGGRGACRHHGIEQGQRNRGTQSLEDGAAVEMFLREEVHRLYSCATGVVVGAAGAATLPMVNCGLLATACTNADTR